MLPGPDVLDGANIGAHAGMSMDDAVATGVDHAGSDAVMETTGKGTNYQLRGTASDESGTMTEKIARFDVNPSDSHVAANGPHLNLETQVNGRVVSNSHIRIDPRTIRPGDHP